MKINTILSKTISHALRHEPWLYELEMDEEGWVQARDLLNSLRKHKQEWANLTETDLEELIHQSSKKRFDLNDHKIRALYGHSLPQKLLKTPGEPPTFLYHGTNSEAVLSISAEGLKPMGRQYVHLSVDINMAREVGYRKAEQPRILIINAKKAHSNGVTFYIGNDKVWLADYVPKEYIAFTDHG